MYNQELLMEDGFRLLQEDGTSIFRDMEEDSFNRGSTDFNDLVKAADDIGWSINNPFADTPFVK
jgi:hypothetical protein